MRAPFVGSMRGPAIPVGSHAIPLHFEVRAPLAMHRAALAPAHTVFDRFCYCCPGDMGILGLLRCVSVF